MVHRTGYLKIGFHEGMTTLKISRKLGYWPISFSSFDEKRFVMCKVFLLRINYFDKFNFYLCSWMKITTMDGRLLANLQGRHTRFVF